MTRKALLVGINDYAPQGEGGSDLEGCVNDVRDMADTLVALGFGTPAVEMMTDGEATEQGMREGLSWLVSGARPGDSLVFYYSGHGSQVPDTNGDERDRRDEVLCPHDTDFDQGRWLADDDLAGIFDRLPEGALIEVILDACHAGTGIRAAMLASLGGGVRRDRYLAAPAGCRSRGRGGWGSRLLRSAGDASDRVLWSACRDDQTSQETLIDGRVRGVFTHHLCRVLRGSVGGMGRGEIDRLVRQAVRRSGFPQVPQLECDPARRDAPPFR